MDQRRPLDRKRKVEPPFEEVLPIASFSSPGRTILELASFQEFKRWLREGADEELQKLEALVLVGSVRTELHPQRQSP